MNVLHIEVKVKKAGRKENSIAGVNIQLPKAPVTVSELIECVVAEVYSNYMSKSQLSAGFEGGELSKAGYMTDEEIDRKSAGGKIDFGFPAMAEDQSRRQAVQLAKQAFCDGEVALFIDGKRYENLTDKISISGGETVTFVKLAMLTGRLW